MPGNAAIDFSRKRLRPAPEMQQRERALGRTSFTRCLRATEQNKKPGARPGF
jgi:hypothetical protein